jgi:O-antigen ligase
MSLATGIVVVFVAAIGPVLGWALAHEEWLILIGMALLAVVPAVVRWPVITTFGAYVFFLPFDSVAHLGAGATLTRFIGIAAVAVLLGAAIMEGRLIRPPAGGICWALFMVWALASSAWAIDPKLALAPTAFSLLLLYLVAVCVRVSDREMAWVSVLMVCGAALAAVASILLGVESAYDTSHGAGARNTLALGEQAANANAFAKSLIGPLALAIGGFIGLRGLMGRLLALVAVATLTAAIYLTMSRGALLGVAVMLAVIVYRFRIRWPILLVGCLLIGVATLMPAAFFDRIASVADRDSTGAGRTEIWKVGIAALEHHGVIGGGFRNFGEIYGRTVPLNPDQGGRAAHNMYLATWVELGVVGLALLLAALGCHLWAARRARGPGSRALVTRAAQAAGFGALVVAFFGDPQWTKDFWLPWVLMAWGVQPRATPATSNAESFQLKAPQVSTTAGL